MLIELSNSGPRDFHHRSGAPTEDHHLHHGGPAETAPAAPVVPAEIETATTTATAGARATRGAAAGAEVATTKETRRMASERLMVRTGTRRGVQVLIGDGARVRLEMDTGMGTWMERRVRVLRRRTGQRHPRLRTNCEALVIA